MKVLHISKRYPPYVGGIETVAKDVVSSLPSETNQLVIAYNDNSNTVIESHGSIQIERIGVQRTFFSQPLSKNYGKYISNALQLFKPDVIYFHFPNPFAAFWVLRYIRKFKFSGRFILHWHCDIIKQRFLKLFFVDQTKKLIKRADAIIVTSPSVFKDTDFLPKYPSKKFYLLPCRIGDSRLIINKQMEEEAQGIRKRYTNKTILFFFGRHVKYKGLKYLIESDKYLDQNRTEIIIGGNGPLTDQLKASSAKFSNISFVGRLTDDQINEYLLACDIFAYPSITRNEAFGIALAEAMHFGKPPVTFTIKGSGVNWVNLNNVTGLEAKNSDAKDYADKINLLISDKNLYSRLSKGAKNRADELFTKEHFNKELNKIYSEVCSNDKKGS